jgi:hypothetical protein
MLFIMHSEKAHSKIAGEPENFMSGFRARKGYEEH